MKTLFTAAATAALMTTGALAQTTQTGVVGASGDSTYSVQVTGADGQIYNCRPQIENIAGVLTRRCVNANAAAASTGGLGNLGAGLGAGGTAAAIGLIVLAIAAGGSSSATTTN